MAEKELKKASKAQGKQGKKEEKANSNRGSATYGAKDITVLEGLEPVRLRPGMYIGSTGTTGLHHLIWEIVDNSIDEVMAGYAKNITVELLPDNKVSVQDDGRGVPVDIHPQTKKSTLETIMTVLHAGGKFGGEGYKVSGGLHGVGASVVNALSSWVKVEVERDGGSYVQEYKRGVPEYKVKKLGASKRHGTKTTFSPDPTVFSEMEFNDKVILERLRQQAYLTKGVRINFYDRRPEVPYFYGFYFEGGVLSYVKFLSQKKNRLNEDIFYVEKEAEKLDIEAAFLYVDDTRVQEMSFANNIFTPEGGMHLTGFRSALTRTLNNFARAEGYLKEKDENLTADDVREGLVAVLSVKLRDPQFEGQTKAKLGNPEARTATESVINEALKEFLEKHPQEGKALIQKVLLTAKARLAAKAARETVLRKGAFEGLTLPGKLADCTSKIAADSELFIVEGDSAGGTAKQGRNRHTQAILPLRGKPLNVERARLDKMLANAEVRSLVIAIGTAIGEEFNIEKLRYHKIVIMTDADVDGAHIRTLLLTLFFRHFRGVVDGGYVYIAQPPLYRIQLGKTVRYAFSDDEKEKVSAEMMAAAPARAGKGAKAAKAAVVAEEEGEAEGGEVPEGATEGSGDGRRQPSIQRYKGLGEMNAEQLWETTMNPEFRILRQVTVDDAEKADKLFDVLMGDAVEPRKNFIQAHAATVQNLDI
ncbi:MAG: DNA topoisomerase (ATP-hydrolyzing) subunit B [Candidatus Pacebacteria bacterium]|nr:DNA topoisomerase (ATP-hydrolyzing) subunit B [Candidatus Paceibacterota bacterium]